MDEEKEINEIFHEHSQKKLKKNKYGVLVKWYPDVFKQIESSLPMPYYLFGFECHEGWYDILDRLAAKINFELGEDPEVKEHFFISQIKEKYGSLRFYVFGETINISEAIEEAEQESLTTCEMCGEKGRIRKEGGWYMVRCDKCWEKRN